MEKSSQDIKNFITKEFLINVNHILKSFNNTYRVWNQISNSDPEFDLIYLNSIQILTNSNSNSDICFKPNKLVIRFLKSNPDSEKSGFNPVFMNLIPCPRWNEYSSTPNNLFTCRLTS